MTWPSDPLGFAAGLLIAIVTASVGVSGAAALALLYLVQGLV